MPRIMHVITGLRPGGAEHVLLNVVSSLTNFEHIVISLTPLENNDLSARFQGRGVKVISLNMKLNRPWHLMRIRLLANLIRQYRPSIIQCWMYHGNIIGGLAGKLADICPVYWNIRNGALKGGEGAPLGYSSIVAWVVRFGAWLSTSCPDKIVYCANRAARIHEKWGYDPNKTVVISNGIDTERFQPDLSKRKQFRDQWGLEDQTHIVGILARFHQQKGVNVFLQAASQLQKQIPEIKFALCGNGMHKNNLELSKLIQKYSMENNIMLINHGDSSIFLNGIDVLCMTSTYGEAFPNVVAEALSCNTPCIVSDVGDAAQIVDNTDWVCPVNNPSAIAFGVSSIINHPNKISTRDKILERFTIDRMINAYNELYSSRF